MGGVNAYRAQCPPAGRHRHRPGRAAPDAVNHREEEEARRQPGKQNSCAAD